MSWDKNTLILSEVSSIVSLLDELHISYTLTVLGTVHGRGLNDTLSDRNYYEIRKLEYKDSVVLEQMHRTEDCDADDYIISMRFIKGQEPKTWPLELMAEAHEHN